METSQKWNTSKLLDVVYLRKPLIVATCLVIFCLAAFLAGTLPDMYRSSTLILVTHQVPQSIQHPMSREDREERIHSMSEQILSRVKLQKIVSDFNLYPPNGTQVTMDDRVEKLQKHIKVNIDRTDSFRMSFEAEKPDLAMQVTARLSALLIDENVKLQEKQLSGAHVVLNAEAERLRKELDKQEAQINQYRSQNRHELPEQLEANLATLNQFRADQQANALRISALREKKAALEQQVAEVEATARAARVEAREDREELSHRAKELESRKVQLDTLLAQYSAKHPDVIRLKHEIQTLDHGETSQDLRRREVPNEPASPARNPMRQALTKQMADLNSEIKSFESTNERLRRDISSYLTRVSSTPIRAEELAKVSRTYEVTLKKYQDLVGQGLDSQHLRNVEYKQARAQFQILDPANYPERPVRPNRLVILFAGLMVGIVGGFALAFLCENQSNGIKDSEELAEFIDVPVLATIPAFTTRESLLEKRRARGLLILASVGTIVIGMACIRFVLPSIGF